MRRDKTNYYLDLAEQVISRGTCLRRNFGAIIVKHDEIVSTGYTGSPRGRSNCMDLGVCKRQVLAIPRGERYEMCRSVHAEANAIISAARSEMIGATLYLVGTEGCASEADGGRGAGAGTGSGAGTGQVPRATTYVANTTSCAMCKRLIINAGIEFVVVRLDRDTYQTIAVQEWIDDDDTSAETGY